MMRCNLLRYWSQVTILIILFISVSTIAHAGDEKSNEPKEEYVLILNSINFNLPWAKSIYWEVREAMLQEGVQVKTEAIGVPSFRTMDDARRVVDSIREKYKDIPQAVLFIGDPAWVVCRELFDDIWKDVPVIISDSHQWLPSTVENLICQAPMTPENIVPVKYWHDGYNVTSITPSFHVKETVELIRQLIPNVNRIAFISDARYVSAIARDEVQKVLQSNFPQLAFSQLSSIKLSTEMMLDSLSSYDKNTGIIYYSWFEAITKQDNSYFIDHIQEVINNFAKSPIFLIATQDLASNNYAGGYYVDPKTYGKSIVDLLMRVRRGEAPKDIPPSLGGEPKAYLSYPHLIAREIDPILFPKNAVYVNSPNNFFNQYRKEIFIISAIVFIIICLTAFYIYILKREKILKENENRVLKLNDHVFKTIQEPICWVNREGVILKILNNPDEKYLTFRPDEISGRSVNDYIQDQQERDLHKKMLIDTLETGCSNRMKFRLRNLRNEDFWIFISMVFYDEQKVLCFLQDISEVERERIRAEKLNEELLMAKEKAEESNRLKSAFLANMSHEIRTPLNAIVGFSSLIDDVETANERAEYIKIIKHNNELLLRLINDVLDLSKIEAGALELCYSSTNVNLLMNDVFQTALFQLDNTNVTVHMDECFGECVIYTDYSRVQQVISNFVTNAIKFTQNGEIHLGYKLINNDKIKFYVSDTGSGLSISDQVKVFERFVKLNSFAQGSGLGLTICKMIVEKFGGEIGVDSVPNEGSTFWFILPIK